MFRFGFGVLLVVCVMSACQPAPSASAIVSEGQALRIVIPAGTQERIEHGETVALVPDEIRLRLTEHNTLIIENGDSVAHSVGPFRVNAHETIRQVFTRPAVYQGACSLHPDNLVSIIIES